MFVNDNEKNQEKTKQLNTHGSVCLFCIILTASTQELEPLCPEEKPEKYVSFF